MPHLLYFVGDLPARGDGVYAQVVAQAQALRARGFAGKVDVRMTDLPKPDAYVPPTWKLVTPPTGVFNNLNAVWGSSATDVWAVGTTGAIVRWQGSGWTSVTSPTWV